MAWAEEVAAVLDAVVPGEGQTAYDEGFGPLTATVPAEHWPQALTAARDALGCTFFDWLSAVDELADGFSVVCHLARIPDSSAAARGAMATPAQTGRGVEHLLVRTTLPRDAPRLPSAVGVFAGAAWHERETTEMFGIDFLPADRTTAETDATVTGAESAQPVPEIRHLLLPEEFEGHPLRKDFLLASRVAKPWPGAKEPGESEEGGSPSRRRTRPPGVPDPGSWGPREPGSPNPDPLAHAQPGAAKPRRRQAADRDEPAATRGRVAPERHGQRGDKGAGEPTDG